MKLSNHGVPSTSFYIFVPELANHGADVELTFENRRYTHQKMAWNRWLLPRVIELVCMIESPRDNRRNIIHTVCNPKIFFLLGRVCCIQLSHANHGTARRPRVPPAKLTAPCQTHCIALNCCIKRLFWGAGPFDPIIPSIKSASWCLYDIDIEIVDILKLPSDIPLLISSCTAYNLQQSHLAHDKGHIKFWLYSVL